MKKTINGKKGQINNYQDSMEKQTGSIDSWPFAVSNSLAPE